ncbi:MAG: hypothetical protein ACK4TA_19790 [Saprospiraceae bacterium]
MKKYVFLIIIIYSFTSCSRESRERLFEVVYPNIQFNLPAGLTGSTPWGFARSSVSSNFNNLVKTYNTDTAVIAGVFPFSARITSLDGFDYDFVEGVSVLMCSTSKAQCSLISDEVFYIDDLRGRAREQIELLPTEKNLEKLLSEGQFRLEVVFYFRQTTPYLVESRLDLVLEAAK